jgi:hypothetical protein
MQHRTRRKMFYEIPFLPLVILGIGSLVGLAYWRLQPHLSAPRSGRVVEKAFVPTHEEGLSALENGVITGVFLPLTFSHEDSYRLRISNNSRSAWVRVPRETYLKYELNQLYP